MAFSGSDTANATIVRAIAVIAFSLTILTSVIIAVERMESDP